jgi:hypothetical protein
MLRQSDPELIRPLAPQPKRANPPECRRGLQNENSPPFGRAAEAFSGEVAPVRRRKCVKQEDESRFHASGSGSRIR